LGTAVIGVRLDSELWYARYLGNISENQEKVESLGDYYYFGLAKSLKGNIKKHYLRLEKHTN